MRYTIRRISVGSALRVAFTLGWLVALCPALGLAAVALRLLRALSQALGQVQPVEISAFGQSLLLIDILDVLRLSDAAQTADRLAAGAGLTFAVIALLLTLLGAAVFMVVALLFSAGYNLLSALGGGLEVELRPARGHAPERE